MKYSIAATAAFSMALILAPAPSLAAERIIKQDCAEPTSSCICKKSLKDMLASACIQTGDTVKYECSSFTGNPSSRCVESAQDDQGFVIRKNAENVKLYASPSRSVELRAFTPPPNSSNAGKVLTLYPESKGWTVEGFIMNGLGQQHALAPMSSYQELAVVGADGTKLIDNHIHNSNRSCVRVDWGLGSPTTARAVSNVTLQGNTISDCIARDALFAWDANCVVTTNAHNLSVLGNSLLYCSGDGVQLEHKPVGHPGWFNVTISNNQIATAPLLPDPANPAIYLSPGEEGIDVKPGQGYVNITGNSIYGFRGSTRPDVVPRRGLGTGHGGSKGAGIIVHGLSESCGEPVAQFCNEISGNDIRDCNLGILVGHNSNVPTGYSQPLGTAISVDIRENVIHALSANAPHENELLAKGAGIRINNADGQMDWLAISRNTIANNPGVPIYQEGLACTGSCNMAGNLISFSGKNCTLKSYAGWMGYQFNLCVPATYNRPECDSIAHPSAGFVLDPRVVHGYPDPECGQNQIAADESYDYSLEWGSPAVDYTPYSSFGTMTCNATADVGAYELCM